jgi:hypothetical protein
MAYLMTDEQRVERATTKAIHTRLRAPLRGGRGGDRYDLLAWAFARGMPYRRCERSRRIQTCGGQPADRFGRPVAAGETPFEHNLPDAWRVWTRLVHAGFFPSEEMPKNPENDWWAYLGPWNRIAQTPVGASVTAWLADPRGALAAPAPSPKKPYAPKAA